MLECPFLVITTFSTILLRNEAVYQMVILAALSSLYPNEFYALCEPKSWISREKPWVATALSLRRSNSNFLAEFKA